MTVITIEEAGVSVTVPPPPVYPDLLPFYVTFGSQYPRVPNPTCEYAHHDGWIRILAPDETEARRIVLHRIDRYWSMIYTAAECTPYPITEQTHDFLVGSTDY